VTGSEVPQDEMDSTAKAGKKFSRILFVKILIVGFCLVATIYLGKWFQRLPKARSGTNLVKIEVNKPELKFFVLGDTGTGDENQLNVAKSMERRCQKIGGVDGIILLGDNFYFSGVTSVDDEQWKTKIEIPYSSDCLSQAPIYPVLGNHDYKGNIDAQIEYSKINPRWKLPYRFYRVDFGNLLRLVAFDSGYPDFCLLKGVCSVDFLKDSLDTTEPVWKIVTAHHPLISSSIRGYGHSGGLFGFLMKPNVCDATDFWFSGHAHHLEHRVEENCQAELFVSGGGGAGLYEVVEKADSVRFLESTFGYLEIEVSKENFKTSFLNIEEKIIYSSNKPR